MISGKQGEKKQRKKTKSIDVTNWRLRGPVFPGFFALVTSMFMDNRAFVYLFQLPYNDTEMTIRGKKGHETKGGGVFVNLVV